MKKQELKKLVKEHELDELDDYIDDIERQEKINLDRQRKSGHEQRHIAKEQDKEKRDRGRAAQRSLKRQSLEELESDD